MSDTPPPGSIAAIRAGCTCPVLDNSHGRGSRYGTDDAPVFVYVADCPVHAGRKA